MNQNNNQIQYTQLQQQSHLQKQQMTQEELQRTQVLNLKDVRETARFEKLTSKKPAIILAIIGIICIAFGTSFGVVQTMNTKKLKDNQKIQNRKKSNLVKTSISSINCTATSMNEPDGTGKILNVVLVFKDERLTSMTKTYSIIPTVAESPESKATVQNFITALQPYLIDITGYKLTVAPETTGGVITTTEANLEILDLNTVPQIHKDNYRFNIPFAKATIKQTALTNMTNLGFKCQ